MNKVVSIIRILSSTRYLVRRLQSQFILRETRGKKFSVVVDIGVGKAPYKKKIDHDRYIGVDIEDRGGVPDVLIEDINNGLSIAENTADLVLCTEVLEHTREPQKVINELYRITKPGGVVLLTTPMVWPVHEAPNDYYRFTNFGLEHLFGSAGFTSLNSHGSNGYVYTMLALLQISMKHWIFTPIVFVLNVVGYVVAKIEKESIFPLGIHIIAQK